MHCTVKVVVSIGMGVASAYFATFSFYFGHTTTSLIFPFPIQLAMRCKTEHVASYGYSSNLLFVLMASCYLLDPCS